MKTGISLKEQALILHRANPGKMEIQATVALNSSQDLSLAYSPGVAEPCKEIFNDKDKVYDYTIKGNLVAIISNGTAVLGLGNIGPEAAIPVMEGKAVLYKQFAGIDAFPLCVNIYDSETFVSTVKSLEPSFGGIILEDIAAPECFEIEERLSKEMNIPVFHDDQHGTAVVTAAGLINALRVVNKSMDTIRVVINGAGAAGIALSKILHQLGVKEIILCDSRGTIYEGRPIGMNNQKNEVSIFTNHQKIKGQLQEAIKDSDVFIGVSIEGALTKEMIISMNEDPIVFALANPNPEIMPEVALNAGAKVIATGRSDFPNQVNNVLAYPGIFRGALDVHATTINNEMKVAAAYALANIISEKELTSDYIVPNPFDSKVVPIVASAVAKEAIRTGVARREFRGSK